MRYARGCFFDTMYQMKKLLLVIGIFLLFQNGASAFEANDVVSAINLERKSMGLSSLSVSDPLSKASKNKALDLIGKSKLEHTKSPYGVAWSTLQNVGYSYSFAGENLALGTESAEETVRMWMRSLGHRENILNGDFREIGVSVFWGLYKGEVSPYVVAYFGTPKKQENNVTPIVSSATTAPKIDQQDETKAVLKKKLFELVELLQVYVFLMQKAHAQSI